MDDVVNIAISILKMHVWHYVTEQYNGQALKQTRQLKEQQINMKTNKTMIKDQWIKTESNNGRAKDKCTDTETNKTMVKDKYINTETKRQLSKISG